MSDQKQTDNKDANKEEFTYETVSKVRSFVSSWLGVIIAGVGVIAIFFITSLEGTNEIKASRRDNAKLMTMFREENPGVLYPEAQVDILTLNGKEYYFIIEEMTDGEITSWYFAYDGGFEYIFQDKKFYLLTGLTFAISLYVSNINHSTAIQKAMETDKFKAAGAQYAGARKKVDKHPQYIQNYCSVKNKQAYDAEVERICTLAGIKYEDFANEKIKFDKLKKWQLKRLDSIKRIRIEGLTYTELMQENDKKGSFFTRRIVVNMLPSGINKHKKDFMTKSVIQRLVTTFLSGLVVTFGVVLGNWQLGVSYGLTVLMSAVGGTFGGWDFVLNVLRYRFLGKAAYLEEYEVSWETYKPKPEPMPEFSVDIKSLSFDFQETKDQPQKEETNFKLPSFDEYIPRKEVQEQFDANFSFAHCII